MSDIYSMPSCANTKSWSYCMMPNAEQSNACVKCNELTDFCKEYSGSGFGKVVPVGCRKTCCKEYQENRSNDSPNKSENEDIGKEFGDALKKKFNEQKRKVYFILGFIALFIIVLIILLANRK